MYLLDMIIIDLIINDDDNNYKNNYYCRGECFLNIFSNR